MYACTGDFKVTYSGVLRKMPKKFINDLVYTHINENFFKTEKIPDGSSGEYNDDYDHTRLAAD